MEIDGVVKFLLVLLMIVIMSWLNEHYPFINVIIILIGLGMASYLIYQANMRNK